MVQKNIHHIKDNNLAYGKVGNQYNPDINDIRKIFEELGCTSEKVSSSFFAMEVPHNIDYPPIKQRLTQLENEEIIGYAEPCLSERHGYKS